MAILIKNPETERKARALASLRGQTLTAVIDGALDRALADATPRPRPSVAEMMAATDQFRAEVGLDHPLNITKADFDAVWDEGLGDDGP